MEPKLELASIDIAAVVHELGAYTSAFFDKAYLYPDSDLLRLKLRHHEHGRLELLAEVGERKRLHLADQETVPDAPTRPPNFAKMLRNRLEGGRLASVEQVGFDRIVRVTFDVPDGSVDLYIELFGDGNLAVVGTDGVVVDCHRTVRLRSRTVAPGQPYEVPAQRIDPFTIERDAFAEELLASEADVVRTLATQLNLGGRYAEEVCTRGGVEKTASVEDLTEADIDALHSEIQAFRLAFESGSFDPHVYEDDHGVVDVSPFDLAEFSGYESTRFETVSSAIDAYYLRLPEREHEEAPGPEDAIAEERARLERILEHQQRTIDEYREEAASLRHQAESLYDRYDLVDDVITTVSEARSAGHGWDVIEDRLAAGADAGIEAATAVTGVEPESARVTIRLDDVSVDVDVGQGVERNANRLYREAKDVEAKIEGATEAIAETEAELEALDAEDAAEVSTEDARGERDWRSMRSVPIRRPEHWYERFRWFHTSDGFLVIGGRNAKQNEELVKKYTEPYDRVFHTQAHGGPITVIKATDPSEAGREVEFPPSTLEEAAQFAVSYSSVWKDGHFAGDVYLVRPEQLTKEAESGEYVAAGGFVVRGEREYFRDTPVGVAVGLQCEGETRVIGGPPSAIAPRTEITIRVEPGRFAQGDVAKRIYRRFRETFTDETFVRKVASPDQIQHFLPPGTSRIVDE